MTLSASVLAPFQVLVVQNVEGRVFTADEIQAVQDWVRAGGGLMTLIGYFLTEEPKRRGEPVKVLSTADALLLAEVYAAGEAPIVAADGRALARAVRVAGKVEPVFVESIDELPEAILAAARPGDVIVTMGAGSIGGVAPKLAAARGAA